MTDDEITAHNLAYPTTFVFHATEDDVRDLAAGVVPMTMRAQAFAMADFDDWLRRIAARPVRPRHRAGGATGNVACPV